MATTSFNTSNETYRKLMASGLSFQIPRYQRDYSWSEENWEDLWLDIEEILLGKTEDPHYMGYLVLQTTDEKNFDVIDGQQRLTTLSIFVLAAMRLVQSLVEREINSDENKQRLEVLRNTYIGFLDPVSLRSESKISLNRNNDEYFRTYLVPLRELPVRGFRASEHLLRKASTKFEKRLKELLDRQKVSNQDAGEFIAKTISNLSDGLFFTVITVADELNAYKVFETLNARGVKLSAPDLLKNYLFSVISRGGDRLHSRELDILDERWAAMVGRLGSENLTNFIRTSWSSRKSFVRQSELFKVIRREIIDRKNAFDLLSNLEDDVEVFLSLANPGNSAWAGNDKDHAADLKRFSVRQPFALLMTARRLLPDAFADILKAIVNISMRYNVILNLQAAEQERTYSRVAVGITEGRLTDLDSVLDGLRSVYPTDAAFHGAFIRPDASGVRATSSRP